MVAVVGHGLTATTTVTNPLKPPSPANEWKSHAPFTRGTKHV